MKITHFTFILLFLICGCSKPAQEEKVLNVYNWANYIGKSTIEDFEREFHTKVNYDNFSNNEELLAKLQAGASDYDVVVPTDYMARIMIAQGRLAPLDKTKIPLLSNIDEKFLGRDYDSTNTYCIPYFWSNAGIAVNTKYIKEPVDSWSILWDEKYKGKISMLDDARAAFIPALYRVGSQMNATDPDAITRAKDELIKQKPLVKTYTSDVYIEMLRNEEVWLAQGYIGDVYQVSAEKPEIKYIIPKEGTEVAIDNLCIPQKAPHKELAHEFINFILRAEVAAKIANDIHYPSPNKAAKPLMNPAMLNDSNIYPPDEVMKRLHFMGITGETMALYDRAWSEVKAL